MPDANVYTAPSGPNSTSSEVPLTVVPVARNCTGESSDGVDRSASIGPGNGKAVALQRSVALSVAATPVTSSMRNCPLAGQLNLTLSGCDVLTALSLADCNSCSTWRAALPARCDCSMPLISGTAKLASVK